MSQPLVLLALYGALVGARHALEPDHLATVSTMAAHGGSRRDVLRVAAAWGAGHASLIIAAAVLLAAFRREIPARLTDPARVLVGAAMIGLGAWSLSRRPGVHVHPHAHGPEMVHSHFHLHTHAPEHSHPLPPAWAARAGAAYGMGLMHGLLGSGAATALAVLAAPTTRGAFVYLIAFGAGSLAGMVAIAALALWPLLRRSPETAWARSLVHAAAGTASIVVGLLLAGGAL